MLCDNLKHFRKAKKLTQEMLAEKLNVTRQAVSNWENGRAEPDIAMLTRVSDILGVSVDSLTGVSGAFISVSNLPENFSVRAVYVVIRDGKILLQREKNGNEYALPGGILATREISKDAITRRLKEETGAEVSRCGRILWIEECHFAHEGKEHSQVAFYYSVEIKNDDYIPDDGSFVPQKCNENVLVGWMPIEKLKDIVVYPSWLHEEIKNIGSGVIKHFVTKEQGSRI